MSITAGRVNASARNTTSGWSACTVSISHSQNAKGLVCGLSTRNMWTPWSTQCSTTPSSASHSCFAVGAVEVEVDDVLVALGRVLGVLDRTVGPPGEPLRVLLQPGVVGRGLDREVEGDLEPELAGARHEAVEVVERAQLGVDRGVTTLGPTDRPGAARIGGRSPRGRCCAPSGWWCRWGGSAGGTRRRSRDRRSRAAPRRTPSNPPNDRGKSSYHAPNAARVGSTITVNGRASDTFATRDLGGARQARRGIGDVDAEQRGAFGELGLEIDLAGIDLAAQLVAPRGGGVDPRADGVLPPTGFVDPERGGEPVGFLLARAHRHARPAARAHEAVAQLGPHLRVTVGHHRGVDLYRVAHGSLHRVPHAVDARRHVRDAGARAQLGVLRRTIGHDRSHDARR